MYDLMQFPDLTIAFDKWLDNHPIKYGSLGKLKIGKSPIYFSEIESEPKIKDTDWSKYHGFTK